MKTARETRLCFGDFEVDATRRVLLKQGQAIHLNPKAFDLLLALIAQSGEIVSKNDLLDEVWENQFVEEKNLSVQIVALRKALGERKDENRFIATVPGKGYKFVAPLNAQNGNSLVIETQKIERITIEEIEEPKNKQLKDKSFSFRTYAFYLLPFAILLLLVSFYAWKNIGRTTTNAPLSVKRLTTNGNVQIAVLSRDGKFFAYSIKEKGTYRTEIRLGQTDGSSDVALIPMNDSVNNPTTFSADGSWLYYVQSKPRESNNGTLYKTPVLGGVSQKLASRISNYPAISPDEKQLAFVRNYNEKKTSSLIIANLDGTTERELVVRSITESIHSLSQVWSANGTSLAFAATNEKNESREIFVANTADGKVTQLTNLNWFDIAKLEWLKDKSSLVAVARDKKTKLSSQIWQIDYPSGVVRTITSDISNYGSALGVSETDSMIAVQQNSESNIWVAPAGNLKEAKQITFGSIGRQDGWNGMDWTADGRIVYSARIDQSLTIWIMNADGTNARQLTPNGFWDKHLRVSADGKFIAFDSNRSGKLEVWRVGTDGNDLRQLTIDGGNSYPSVTPDGKWLVYEHANKDGNSVRRVAIEGGEPIIIVNKNANNPQVSPDGKFVACGYSGSGKRQLAIFSIEGGEPLKLFDVPPTHNFDNTAIRWSPDGRFINYRDWSNGIWQQSIEGGAPVRLENLPQEKFYTYGWSADGKQFAFARGQEIRDVVLMNNFR